MCSCRTWAGSRDVDCVVWARSSDSVMDTWKYSVPFSSHCCFQCTWEMSSPVPDISKKEQGKRKGRGCLMRSTFNPRETDSQTVYEVHVFQTLLCHNFVHLCSWLSKNYWQAIALLSCFDEIFMTTTSSPMALFRDMSQFKINKWQASQLFQPSHSIKSSIIDKIIHRWERLILGNIHLFRLLFFGRNRHKNSTKKVNNGFIKLN